ncbi:MAG: helix-turn-helix transcriptional regulator [Pseudomonadota bacterium]
MNRTADAEIIRRLRHDKGWSQEELALASGLSTRTIQRLETDGVSSASSIKSVAAALEVSRQNLEKSVHDHAQGLLLGLSGVALGTVGAIVAIWIHWHTGGGSAYEAGVGFGLVGLISGVSSALIGCAYNHANRCA